MTSKTTPPELNNTANNTEHLSLQEQYASRNACFGCGPANPEGLKLRSYAVGEEVIAKWQPQKKYEAFPNVLNGGIIAALLDCHSNWTAAWCLMQQSEASSPPCTVTAEFSVKLLKPTPTQQVITLKARLEAASKNSATIVAEMIAEGEITATFTGRFVAVKPDHPGYHRW